MKPAQKPTAKPTANTTPKAASQVPSPQIAAPPPKLIFVRDLHPSVAAKDLIMDVFREDGDITSVSVHADVHGQSLGTAEVQFRSGEEAESAYRRHNGRVYKGKPMRMSLVGLEIKNVRPKPAVASPPAAVARSEVLFHPAVHHLLCPVPNRDCLPGLFKPKSYALMEQKW
jgi:RNA recognition motif-containing protein